MITLQGLVYALVTMLFWSSFSLVSRKVSVQSDSPLVLSFAYNIVAAIFSLFLLPLEPWRFISITPDIIFITFLATVFFGLYALAQFYASKYVEASRLTVLYQIAPIVTFVGSLVFLGEGFSYAKLIAVACIVLGNIIAIYNHGGQITARGFFYALCTVVAVGCAYVADKAAFSHYPLGLYMAITYFFPGLYVYFVLLARGNSYQTIAKELKRQSWRLALLALLSTGGYFMLLKTFQVLEASVALPLVYTSTILTALGGIIILRERGNIPQKLFGALFVVMGVVLLR